MTPKVSFLTPPILKSAAVVFVAAAGIALTIAGARASVSSEQLLAIIQEQGALIRQQGDKIERLEKRLDHVEGSIRRTPAPQAKPPRISTLTTAVPPAADPRPAGEPDDVIVKWKGGPRLQTRDGNFVFQPTGRVMSDFWTTTGSNDDDRNITGTEVRRARIGMQGNLYKHIKYKAEIEFADEEVAARSLYVAWLDDYWQVYLGYKTTDYSFNAQTSSKYTELMERAVIVEGMRPETGRQAVGATLVIGGDNWHVSAAALGDDIDNPGVENDSFTLASRAHWAPLHDDGQVLHLGGWFWYEDFNRRRDVDEATRIGNHFNDNVRVRSGDVIGARHSHAYGAELAGAWGPFSFASEYARRDIDASGLGGDYVGHQGFYASAGLFLTGENRAYDAEGGSWGRVKPLHPVTDGGLGAWQLAGRFDYVDYDDPLVAGDKAHALTLGLNWHPISHARIMANWVYWDIVGANDDGGHHFGMRAQVDW